MSVLLETSLGDIVIDLETEACPKTCENFLKLCKVYYYNLNAFFNVSKDFLAQVGDPTASGTGGESIWSYLASLNDGGIRVPRYFPPEIRPKLKHSQRGTVSMAVAPGLEGNKGGCGSQFFITLGDNIDYLDGKHAVFGHVVEGMETLEKLNEVFVDQDSKPFKDVRIRHVIVLDDPFPDPVGLAVPPSSPTRPPDRSTRIAEDEDPLATLPEEDEERIRREKAAAASALTLEMVGDLPFANVRPPENVLFVCKLNPVTRDEDLELIFSRFGTIMSCQVIRDKKTGDSLQYAFIEFDKREEAEQAYFKMQNVLVDDRRIWVDFSQSVSKSNHAWSNDIVKPKNYSRGFGQTTLGDPLKATTEWYLTSPVVLSGKDQGNAVGAATETERRAPVAVSGQGHILLLRDTLALRTTTEVTSIGKGREVGAGNGTLAEGVDIKTSMKRAHWVASSPFGIPFVSSAPWSCQGAADAVLADEPFIRHDVSRRVSQFQIPSIPLRSFTISSMMFPLSTPAYEFDSPSADVVLKSSDAEPTEFRLHQCILAVASPFFRDMFSLPQDPSAAGSDKVPVISVSETRDVLGPLMRFVYPVPDPLVVSLDDLDKLLAAAVKYEFEAVIASLRGFLIAPQFLHASPVKVYAMACQYDLMDEAKVASRHTLSTDLLGLEADVVEELKKMSAFDFHRLLRLRKGRSDAAIAFIRQVGKECDEGTAGIMMCMQCNGPVFMSQGPPKWWIEWERLAREELGVRPTTEVVFGLEFLYGAARKSGCLRCMGSVVESWKVLRDLKDAIDSLPSTI